MTLSKALLNLHKVAHYVSAVDKWDTFQEAILPIMRRIVADGNMFKCVIRSMPSDYTLSLIWPGVLSSDIAAVHNCATVGRVQSIGRLPCQQ